MKSLGDRFGTLREAYAHRDEPEHFRVLTRIYWKAVLLATACMVVLVVVYGLWQLIILMRAPVEDPSAPSVSTSATSLLDPTELEKTVNSFIERGTRYESLRANPPTVPDPSR